MNNKSDSILLKTWRPYALIAGAAFLVYFKTLFFGLTYFDDHIQVLQNQEFLKHWGNFLVNFKRSALNPFGGGSGYYRPLGVLTAIWDAHISGTNPFSYHLTSVFLHCGASCLVFTLLNRINKNASLRINLFLALLFAAHPVSVAAVAWIIGRGESLLTLFILLSFYFYLRGRGYLLLHLFFFLCALFTKELALVFPVILCFYRQKNRGQVPVSKNRGQVPVFLGWIVCALIFILANRAVMGSVALGMSVKDIFWSVIKNSPGIFLYIGKIFLPVNLSVLPILRDSNLLIGGITTAVLAGLLIAMLVYAKRAKKAAPKPDFGLIAFGLIWFLVFLIPTFISPDLKNFLGFLEQRAYLPMVGMLFALQGIAVWEKGTATFSSGKSRCPLLIAVLCLFAGTAMAHSLNYRDRLTFWKRAVADSPHSPLARRNLGAMFYLDGDLAGAQKEFEQALALNPREPMAHNNLGLILSAAGKFEEAEKEFQEELRLNPLYDDAHFNYGLLKYRQGKKEEAVALWERTVELNPGYASAWRALVTHAREAQDQQKAQEYLDKAKSIGLKL